MTNEEMMELLNNILDASKEEKPSTRFSEKRTDNLFNDLLNEKPKKPAKKSPIGIGFANKDVDPDVLKETLFKTEMAAMALDFLFEEYDIEPSNVLSALVSALITDDIEAVTGKEMDTQLANKYVPIFLNKANDLDKILESNYGTKDLKQRAILDLILATKTMTR